MSTHAISGKPGGGKTMYSVKLILDELLYGIRTIITNVGLNLESLNEFLQREYPQKSIDLFKRIILIDEDQMGQFFTIRPPGSTGPSLLTKEQWSAGKIPDYSGITDSGVMYVLDEIHIKFNARAWMNTGQDVLYYLSQHRKLGDTVVWITQAINNVDKQFRSVTQDYTFIRNLAKERMSHFSLPSIFTRQTYTTPPTDNSTPMETGSFRMNVKGLASLYDTAKGVGIHGRAGADMGEKKKGLPWWVGVSIVVIIAILCFTLIPKLIAGIFSPKIQPTTKPVIANIPALSSIPTNVPTAITIKQELELLPRSNTDESNTNKTYATGYHKLFGKYVITLSDGTEITEGDPLLQQIHFKKGIKYDGKFIPYAKPTGEYKGFGPLFTELQTDGPTPQQRYIVVSPTGQSKVMSQ